MSWFKKRAKRTYLDYASATPVLPEALRAIALAERAYANPGAIHAEGVAAKRALEAARATVAHHLGVKARHLVFTSGLTEANNLAILGFARQLERVKRTLKGTHWIVSAIEHDSVLESFAEVERLGGSVTYLDPDTSGVFTPEAIKRALRPETVFLSIGWANNEIGTVQPIAKIRRRIREHEAAHHSMVIFHTDAGQAPLYLPTVISSLGVDLLALGSNKLYGPHGCGALFVDDRAELARVMQGGPQERGLRAGTESAALASGFAAALAEVARARGRESKRVKLLRDELMRALTENIPGLLVNGDISYMLPHMLNVSIPNIQSEYVTLALDAAGIAVSTKSACREGEERRSHVVESLGGEPWRAENTLRFSLGRDTTSRDIRNAAAAVRAAVARAR